MTDTWPDPAVANLLHGWAVGTTRPCVYPGSSYDELAEVALERAAAALRGQTSMFSWFPIEVEGVLLGLRPLAETYLLNNTLTPSPTVVQFTGNIREGERIHLLQLVFVPGSVEGEATHQRSSPRNHTLYQPGSVGWREGGLVAS